MNLKNIIQNGTNDINEMLFLVQEYIKIRKNKDIQINLGKNIHQNDSFAEFKLLDEINKLKYAYDFARNWLLENDTIKK